MLKLKVINQRTNEFYESRLRPQQNNSPECLIGRHPSCDLVLNGPTVSRVHGRILFQGQHCYFSDLGSTDGSRLNNETMAVTQVREITVLSLKEDPPMDPADRWPIKHEITVGMTTN